MKIKNVFPKVLKITVVSMFLGLSACQIPYIMESAWTHLNIVSKKQSLDKAIRNPKLSEDWKNKLRLSKEIRPFIEKIGLKRTKNYQSFVDLKKEYISYLLIVAPKYSLKPKSWSFPIVGSFPYKGFHNLPKAKAESEKFKRKNYDTYVRGVNAYSTLGWFNDPLLSTMMKYTEADLVETVIHESVHATIFIKNNVSFNERLAVFIAQKATLEYYKSIKVEKEDSDSKENFQNLENSYKDERTYLNFISQCIQDLNVFYKNKSNHNEKAKSVFFSQLKEKFQTHIQPKLIFNKYSHFLEQDLNNAFFAAQGTYFKNLNTFEDEYEKYKSIKDFITYLKSIKKKEIIQKFDTQDDEAA